MSRGWSFFFLLLPLAVLGVFGVAPYVGWTFPENISQVGAEIDRLYGIILVLTGVVFVATNAILVYILLSFRDRPGRKATYTHGNGRLELLWTATPAALMGLVFCLQLPTYWKLQAPVLAAKNGSSEKPRPLARVTARRFEWVIRFAGQDGRLDTPDDVIQSNELHIPGRQTVLLDLTSEDVIHSLFLPELRFKQDAVPGMVIPINIDAQKSTLQRLGELAPLRHADVLDARLILTALREGKRPADKKLASWFSALATAANAQDLSIDHDLLLRVVDGLNRVIRAEDLEKLPAFGGMMTNAKHQADLATLRMGARVGGANRERDYRRVANRRLLEAAYPSAIRPLRGDYELLCAELCGWGHYLMHGRLVVHESEEDFRQWLAEAYRQQEASK